MRLFVGPLRFARPPKSGGGLPCCLALLACWRCLRQHIGNRQMGCFFGNAALFCFSPFLFPPLLISQRRSCTPSSPPLIQTPTWVGHASPCSEHKGCQSGWAGKVTSDRGLSVLARRGIGSSPRESILRYPRPGSGCPSRPHLAAVQRQQQQLERCPGAVVGRWAILSCIPGQTRETQTPLLVPPPDVSPPPSVGGTNHFGAQSKHYTPLGASLGCTFHFSHPQRALPSPSSRPPFWLRS